MSVRHSRSPLNASRVRARKRTLAARDGSWCAYCGRLFADLRCASIDHVVPLSLFATWRAENTVLACQPCNLRKSDRLSLLLSLLLTADDSRQTRDAVTPHVTPLGRVRTSVDWLLLARLAAAAESACWRPESADRPRERSHPDQSVPALLRGRVRRPVPDSFTRLDAQLEAA